MTIEHHQAALSDQDSALRLAGFLASLVLVGGAAAGALTQKLIPWPFHGAASLAGTYGRILIYLPVAGFALASLLWLRDDQRSVRKVMAWPRFSPSFLVGVVLSGGYSLYLFRSHDFALKGLPFVPPAMIIGFLNALSEELIFRAVLLGLLIQWSCSLKRSNLVQALAYGSVHLPIGGPGLFIGAVAYGLLLGWITQSNESVIPALICHAIADVGAVGLPLLIVVA